MPSFLPELTRRTSGALAVAVLAAGLAPAANAALQGRDLDGNAATYEAYYDTALNITWLADANYAKTTNYAAANFRGRMTWNAAKTWAAQLNINGTTGWRLSDVKPVNGSSFNYGYSTAGTSDNGYNITSPQSEMAHLYHVTLGNKSLFDTSGNYQPDFGLRNTGPFSNVQPYVYWSGVAYAPGTGGAWGFDADGGAQDDGSEDNMLSAWAVRPGDVAVAVVPEPETYALMLAGLAALLVVRRRRHH